MQTKHLHPVFLSLYDVEWQLSADSIHSQFSGNGGALSQSALEGHSTAVKTDNVFDNGEAQSSSAHTSATALIHPEKPLENPLLHLLRNADARILYRQVHIFVVPFHPHEN